MKIPNIAAHWTKLPWAVTQQQTSPIPSKKLTAPVFLADKYAGKQANKSDRQGKFALPIYMSAVLSYNYLGKNYITERRKKIGIFGQDIAQCF